MFTLIAVTELASTGVARGQLPSAETAMVGADDQPAAGPNILVLNDFWRYVPAYFQTLDAVQPRSEAGRRLLERRRRQKERQQQQQQQQRRRDGGVVETEAAESQRGTLPVDELLAYITNSATSDATATPSSGAASTSRRGRRKNKQSTPSSDTGEDSSTPSSTPPDDSRRENLLAEVGKKELRVKSVAAGDVADGDAADFVIVRRDGKHRPERPVQRRSDVSLGGRRHRKAAATFCDSLDEFSLHGDTVTTRPRTAEQADVNKMSTSAVVNERRVSRSLSPESSQPPPVSVSSSTVTEMSSHGVGLRGNSSSSERVRPVTLCYNDVVKGSRPSRQEKSVVALSTKSSIDCQRTDPCYTSASDVKSVETTNSPTTTNGNDAGVSTTSVEPVDVPTTTTDDDSSVRGSSAVVRVVDKVSCSTQTGSDLESPAPRRVNYAAVDDITETDDPPRRPNPVVFVESAKTDNNNAATREGLGLSFGSFDDVSSSETEARDVDKAASSQFDGAARACTDAATSPVQQLSGSPTSPATPPEPSVVSGRCRAPLCRSSGGAVRAPVGIVPPIMHVVAALGDVSLQLAATDQRHHFVLSTHQRVRRLYCVYFTVLINTVVFTHATLC